MAKKLAFDKVLFTTVTLLLAFGLVMVYSASAALARQQQPLTFNPFLIKQAVAAGLGLVLMVWLMVLDYRTLRRPAVIYSLLFGVMALLVLVLFAPERNATHRWFFVGGFSFQPSELAKLALIPFLAYLIEKKQEQVNQASFLVPAALFTGLLAALILIEPDMGTAVLLAGDGLLHDLPGRAVLALHPGLARRGAAAADRPRAGRALPAASGSSRSSTPRRTRSAAASRRCSR